MKKFILGVLLLTIGCVNAQTTQELFEQGNKQYQEEKYDIAIKLYKEVVDKGFESVDLYFNMANTYYKTNHMAEAIYYYEKALIIDALNKDVKVNLEYAKRSIIDNIKSVPKSTFDKFNDTVLSFFSYDTWSKIAVATSLLAGVVWMLFFFSTIPNVKKSYFTLGLIACLTCFITLAITIHQYDRSQKVHYAIVFSDQVEVKNAPRESATENFTLHEGTKVQIMDRVGNWEKIKIEDGQVGWVLNENVKKL